MIKPWKELPMVMGWCWGDGQIHPTTLPPLYRACMRGTPMAKVVRTERKDGTKRKVITTGYAWAVRAIGGEHPDVNGCPKLLRREALEALAPKSTDWFLDAEVMLGAQRLGWTIATHPAAMEPRTAGRSKVRTSTLLEFAWNLARWRMTHSL